MLEQARVLEADDPGLVAADAARPGPRLLVIDDDHLHCTIICRIATRAGFAPGGAATYEAAAKLAQETAFECITLDLSLGAHGRRRDAAPPLGAWLQGADHHHQRLQ
jgi:PleD family two-component response regulator